MTTAKSYEAFVEKIVFGGKHGPYAVARSQVLGTVTFSMNEKVWQEKDWPELGTCVVLSQVRKKRAGWRAQHGRFFEPSDEQKHQQ
jgi:hypothetical protein